MIVKYHEVSKIDLKKYNYFLFYGDNEGLKEEIIEKNFKKNFLDNIFRYEEKEILDNKSEFFDNVLTKSFFDDEKLIIISRTTDKIKEIIEEVIEKNPKDVLVLLNSKNLEKKSTLRRLFEKQKNIICAPFYEDNNQTLNSIVSQYFRNKNIPISQQLMNVLIERSRGDRKNLNNELKKIESFSLNKKNINIQEIIKLTNLADNYSASELVDHSLAKNTRKTVTILNENNYSEEDNIIIIRTLLAKLKRLIKIYELVDEKKNIEQAVSIFKPPIFWKDKTIVVQQMRSWESDSLKNLIYEANHIEFLIKKNSGVAKNILFDFIINNSKKTNNLIL
tara:strand:+ start:312 stop:1316 length:1005 start_codon:yes stop_codon:yes gene_type:complete